MRKKIGLIMLLSMILMLFSINVCAQDVTVEGNKFTISEDFSDEDIPTGFVRADITYESNVYKGLASADDSVYKLYLVNEKNPSLNGFYTYLGQGQFQTGNGIVTNSLSITVESPKGGVTIPNGYKKTKVSIGGSSITAYKQKDDKKSAEVNNYLVYGTTDGTEHSWYIIEPESNTAVKANISKVSESATLKQDNATLEKKLKNLNTKYNKNIKKAQYMFLSMCLISLLCFFLMINAMIKRRHNRMDMEDRIIDLKLNGGVDTMKIKKGDLKKRRQRDIKAMERNNISPSELDNVSRRNNEKDRKRPTSNRSEHIKNNSSKFSMDDLTINNDAKKMEQDTKAHNDLGKKNKKANLKKNTTFGSKTNIDDIDFGDDLEFISLDLDD